MSLTGGHQGLAQKPKKAKAHKPRGVNASGSGGAKPGSVSSKGIGRGTVRLLPPPKLDPGSVLESSDTGEESDGGLQSPSHSHKGNKSDQFALSPVTPPQGLLTPCGITTPVTDNLVLAQDPSPVLDSTRPSSSTPVRQEGTAAQPLQLSVEVYVVPDSEQDATDVSEGPVGALSRMSLGTQWAASCLTRGTRPSLHCGVQRATLCCV